MIVVPEAFKSWLIGCVGRRLLLAWGVFHVFESKKDGNPQAVSLLFDGEILRTLKCSPDGSSIAYSSDILAECDLGEFGAEKVFPLENDEFFASILGKEVTSASLVLSSVEDSVAGVLLQFSNSEFLILINLGDELFVYKEIPAEIVKCEGLEFLSLL